MTKRKRISLKTRKKQNQTGAKPCVICEEQHYLDTHHIEGRKIPNYNHKSNLADVCPNCHRIIHKGDIVIEKWVMTSAGRTLLWHSRDDESITNYNSKTYLLSTKS